MELWVSLILLALCVAGFILAAHFLKKRPAARRFAMLACVIFGAMLLLYSCLTAFMLCFASPDPETPGDTPPAVTQPLLDVNTVYLSLDDVQGENGTFYLHFTAFSEDLTALAPGVLPLSENVQASMLPGWDERGGRVSLFTAKDFAQYWDYSREQGFPAVGSLCRFHLHDGVLTDLNEIDPAKTLPE